MAGEQFGTVSHHFKKYNFSGFGTEFPVNEKQQNCSQDRDKKASDIKPGWIALAIAPAMRPTIIHVNIPIRPVFMLIIQDLL
jgi:hypothetical protein